MSIQTRLPGRTAPDLARTPEIRELLERAASWIARRPRVVIGIWLLAYWPCTLVLSNAKPLWNDELFTLYISKLGTMHDVWNALLTGAEQIPPFFFVLTRLSIGAFGLTTFGLRFPAMLGFAVCCLGLFWFVQKRVGVAFGLVAMLFPLVTGAYDYAFEARPYGLVLGFCSLALCFWQRLGQNGKQASSRFGLTLCIACAISCHYYAVLPIFSLCLGECIRSIVRKHLQVGTWIALAIGCVPVFFYLPLIRAARSYAAAFWSKVLWTNVVGYLEVLLTPTVLALFFIPVVLGTLLFLLPDDKNRISFRPDVPLEDVSVVLVFAAIPIIAVILGQFVTGTFNFRYALPAVLGISLLVSWVVACIGRSQSYVALAACLVLLGTLIVNVKRGYFDFRTLRSQRDEAYHLLQKSAVDLPVVISAPHIFFELSHQAEREGKPKTFVYLADVPLAIQRQHTDTVERGLITLRNWAPLDVRDFRKFVDSHQSFYVYGYPAPFEWVTQELTDEGKTLLVKSHAGGRLLYLVNSPR